MQCTSISIVVVPLISSKDEVVIAGMMKFHNDCGFGRAGPGRKRAVLPKSPHVVARSAQPYVALRLTFASSAKANDPSVYTFYLQRNQQSFKVISELKSSGKQLPVVPPLAYDPVDDHRVRSSRGTAADDDTLPARVTVADVSGNYCASTDSPPVVRGRTLTANLKRLEHCVVAELVVSWDWDKSGHRLTLMSGSLTFTPDEGPQAAELSESRPSSPVHSLTPASSSKKRRRLPKIPGAT